MKLLDRNIATKDDLNRPWSGHKSNFRCGICGYKFKIGDGFRMIYTNNLPLYGGNPLACDECNNNDPISQWKKNWDEYREMKKNSKFWRMFRQEIEHGKC